MDNSEQPGLSIEGAHSPRVKPGALNWRRLQRALEFVEQHLEEPITLERLCASACLSKFHFSRAFRLAVGISPQRYVRARRLKMAKGLLLESYESLDNIAFACQFSSQANFSRAFRSATGLTPGRYRQTHQPKPPYPTRCPSQGPQAPEFLEALA
jgi:AraC family transcriptional regulator